MPIFTLFSWGLFLAIIVSLFMIFKTLLMSPIVWIIVIVLILFFRKRRNHR